MVRFLIFAILLAFSGCGASIAPESPDAKAIKAYIREGTGDGVDPPRVKIIESGKCSEYAVNLFDDPRAGFFTDWKSPNNRCVIATLNGGSRRLYAFGDDGKISSDYGIYKRK